ncbi:MAG: hypothetical protein BMS9Abin10_0976 [Gammaproteobacteria bacterium]|nr:MAG: hypothetical protein BMS9Abin10_0976 [Gammaproteobacteria bacterium]
MTLLAVAALSYALFVGLRPPPLAEGVLYGNGHIEATEVTVSAEVGGRVVQSNFVEGVTVDSGKTLVRLNDADLRVPWRKCCPTYRRSWKPGGTT